MRLRVNLPSVAHCNRHAGMAGRVLERTRGWELTYQEWGAKRSCMKKREVSQVVDTEADLRKADRTVTCRWCKWLETAWPVLHEDETFVVLGPGAERCSRNRLTLFPKTHAPVLTELSPDAMVAVLAGLSRLSLAIRQTSGLDHIAIQTHPADPWDGEEHMHFHPFIHDNLRTILGDDPGEREMTEEDLLAIAEAMVHSRGGLALDRSV